MRAIRAGHMGFHSVDITISQNGYMSIVRLSLCLFLHLKYFIIFFKGVRVVLMGEGHIEESFWEHICLLEILKSFQFTPHIIKQESLLWPLFPIGMCPLLRCCRVENQPSLENS